MANRYYAGVTDALYNKKASTRYHSIEEAAAALKGLKVTIDVANVAGLGPGRSVDQLCGQVHQWVTLLLLAGATPIPVVEGRFQAPGSGKHEKAIKRLEVADEDPVQIHEAGFYEFCAPQFDRFILTKRKRKGEATFEEFHDEVVRRFEAMGLVVCDFKERPGEGEGGASALTIAVRIDGQRDEAACDLVLTGDDDALAYRGRAFIAKEGPLPASLHELASVAAMEWGTDENGVTMRWYESLSAATAVSKFGFDSHADLLLLYYYLGVGDHARPIEEIIPAFARQDAAKDALKKLQRAKRGGKQAPAAVRKAWVDIISARQKAVTSVVGFIKRLSGTVRASSAHPNAFAAMRHLASTDGNDTSICTAGSYNKYVRPALGGEFGSDARNTVVLFLAAFEEEMKNGGARALCGENYSADELRAARARVRGATYPSEILTATSSSAAFDWLNGQCGGGHLPTSGPHYDWIMRRLDWVRDALGDGDY